MRINEIRKMQDEMDALFADYEIERGIPGAERLANRAFRLQDEIDEAKCGMLQEMLPSYGIR